MLVITGPDLADILFPLNCITPGITVLADLLNVKKMFPRSYQTLTVPIYNADMDLPAKTDYFIYTQDNSGSVNPLIEAPGVQTVVGTITPPGPPAPPVIPELPEITLNPGLQPDRANALIISNIANSATTTNALTNLIKTVGGSGTGVGQ